MSIESQPDVRGQFIESTVIAKGMCFCVSRVIESFREELKSHFQYICSFMSNIRQCVTLCLCASTERGWGCLGLSHVTQWLLAQGRGGGENSFLSVPSNSHITSRKKAAGWLSASPSSLGAARGVSFNHRSYNVRVAGTGIQLVTLLTA